MNRTAAARRTWWLAGGMLGLAIGYFVWYTPYAALTKALTSGLLPGMEEELGGAGGGFVILPAAALGTLVGATLFLTLTGWKRYIGTRQVFGRMMRFPSRTMIIAGFFMSLVIATTTLNYTFAGISILFMVLMMRGGVLILSPIVDTLRRRKVRVYSWLALGLSLCAVVTALVDVNSYVLTIAALLTLGFYFAGYIGRFQIMSKVAKTGDEQTDRRYFAEEAITAAVWQVVLCAVLAVLPLGTVSEGLSAGFTSFLATPAVLPAFGIGLLYSALYVYGTLIYLDPREYTWCVPANRCASLLSGLVASFGLAWLTGIAIPGTGQLWATGFIFLAILALSFPAIRESFKPTRPPLLLFVCGGNTCRSAMAEAIARVATAANRWRVASAGIEATPGEGMPSEATAALDQLGVPAGKHRARLLTSELIAEAHTVYVMTEVQRAAVAAIAPEHVTKIICLDPSGDLPNPHGKPQDEFDRFALRLREVIPQRLDEAAPAKV